jgi:hypothetical protein
VIRRATRSDTATVPMRPMDLEIADHLVDQTGEWEVIARPFSTAAGKTVHARVRKVGEPMQTDLRTWGADEWVSVRREERKR